jgi:hypothetical protein
MPGLIENLALVSETPAVPLADVARVAAALQKQATRDLWPIWSIQATVDVFARLEDIPLGYWPMIVMSDLEGAAGVHLDRNGRPFALIEAGASWSLTASHECLEMLVDPFGNRTVAGQSPRRSQGRVEFLVEICDPCEDASFAYTVNGEMVSDFYTPAYFDPSRTKGARYSFTGAVTRPRQVLRGGYLSWFDPVSGQWWQQSRFGARSKFRGLGRIERGHRSIRSIIDQRTPQLHRLSNVPARSTSARFAKGVARQQTRPMAAHAAALREEIAAVRRAARRAS